MISVLIGWLPIIMAFLIGFILDQLLVNKIVNGKYFRRVRYIKFTDGKNTTHLIGPYDNREFAKIIYSINCQLYGDAIDEIDEEV